MISLYHDPNGEKVLTLSSLHPKNTTASYSESHEETISGLCARIKELESKLSIKEVHI